MELLQNPEVKSTYDKCKYKVKYWEHQFKKKNGRLPSRLDIREADRDIRLAYKTYFNLKSAALEQSFQDIDGFNSDEDSPNASNAANSNSDANGSHDSGAPEDALKTDCSNGDGVWGTHLSNAPEVQQKQSGIKKLDVNASFTQKLFKNSSLSKRNPRKSLSFVHRRSENNLNASTATLSQPLPEKSSVDNSASSEKPIFKALDTDRLLITKNLEPVISQPLTVFQSLESNVRMQRKNIDAGWLERVAQNTGANLQNENYDVSNFGSSQSIQKYYDSCYNSDEDVIVDSDEEDYKLHITKKRKIEVTTRPSQNIPTVNEKTERLDFSNIFKKGDENELTKNNIEANKTQPIPNEPTQVSDKIETQIPKTDKKQPKQTKKPTKKATLKSNNPQPSGNVRKSTRQRKTRVQIEEDDDDPKDPFADSGEDDPVYSPTKELAKKQPEEEEGAQQPKPVKKAVRRKKAEKEATKDETEDNEEGATYELEYSVKPRRITVPRNTNLKAVVKTSRRCRKKKVPEEAEVVEEDIQRTSSAKSKRQQELAKLQKKIKSGNLNENYVQINIQKKVFVRGKKSMNFSKYKKKLWKKKKEAALTGPNMDMGGCDGGMLTCFNCGQIGHFAQKCQAGKSDKLLPKEAVDDEYCPYPTLEEASEMAQSSALAVRKSTKLLEQTAEASDETNVDASDEIEANDDEADPFSDDDDDDLLAETLKLEEHLKKLDTMQYVDETKTIQPYYKLNENGSVIDTPKEVFDTLRMFGHSSFRPGQEKAVMRILSGQSTLVTLSTGSGKSLCYQIPAFLYAKREPCIALVISPLVSLMEDQVTGVPAFLKAACLHTNKTKSQREKILEQIGDGDLDILLVSPEAVVAGEKNTGIGSLLRKLPPVAFACIDEAHCVSQWSHNFRPSYLMICGILKERLGINTILGLTATATRATSDSIVDHLSIPDGRDGIISDIPLPNNLRLTISKDANRDQALLGLFMSERFKSLKSIIIYCIRRQECERIASFLRTVLKGDAPVETNTKKRKRVNVQAEPYHAGLPASRRRTIQKNFMSGDLRIVVATVAFGMGINKSDIRAVIHYNLPKNFESYVQEVGRAGRDGIPAHCHLFLDSLGRDANELQRHIFSDSIDRHVIRKLLQKIFIPCSCKQACPKHEVAFSMQETVLALDIPEENISTLLCYLELHNERYIEVLSPAYVTCKIIAYGGANIIRKAAKDCPPLAMALAMFGNESTQSEKDNSFEFPVVEVAAAMGWDSGICKHKLKNLEWDSVNNEPKRSLLSVQFTNLGFRLLAPGNLSGDQLDETLDRLYQRVVDQEKTALLQLHALHNAVTSVAAASYRMCISDEITDKELKLKSDIREYFDSPNPLKSVEMKEKTCDEGSLVNDVRAIVSMYRDNTFTGRAVTRIFFGISSPNYPAVIWGRCRFWRSHIDSDFNAVCRIATKEILRLR